MLLIEKLQRLDLGYQGEGATRTIQIDCKSWLQMHENGVFSLWHRRPGEAEEKKTEATFDAETGVMTWRPTEYDTFYAGKGEAIIKVVEGEAVRKTKAIITIIRETMEAAES